MKTEEELKGKANYHRKQAGDSAKKLAKLFAELAEKLETGEACVLIDYPKKIVEECFTDLTSLGLIENILDN